MIFERSLLKEIQPYFNSPEAIVITGMRRTGKTTLLKDIFNRIESENKLYLDLENPLTRKYFEETNYEAIKASLSFLGLDFSKRAYLFLDEIQFQRNLPSVAKYFIDHDQVKFFLTGSASFYLKNLFGETLAGRKFIFELFPLSFREFLHFKESSISFPQQDAAVTQTLFDTIAPLYEEYLRFGGFPGVVLRKNPAEKKLALADIFSSFFQQEIVQLGDFRKNEVIRDLILLLAQRIGSKLDVQRISREIGMSRPRIYEYLAFLEGTYLIKTIRPYSRGRNGEIRKAPKIYFCDTGLADYLARLDPGLLFENSIFQNLRLRGDLHYYQRKGGLEVDFISDDRKAYEVRMTPQPNDVRKLARLAAELNLEDFRVVIRRYADLPGVTYGFLL